MPFSSTSQFRHRSCPVSGIGYKPLRLETEAPFCPFDHGPCRADLGLANGARGFDVNDDAELHVDEIVVGVSEECRPLVRPSTALQDRTAKRTSGQRRWRHPTRYRQGSPDIPSPRDWTSPDRDPSANPDRRSSAACWHRPQSGSHRRQSLRHQPDRPQCTPRRPVRTHDGNISLAETLVTGTRKCRMIRDSISIPSLQNQR